MACDCSLACSCGARMNFFRLFLCVRYACIKMASDYSSEDMYVLNVASETYHWFSMFGTQKSVLKRGPELRLPMGHDVKSVERY